MKYLKLIKKLKREQDGNVIVTVALFMTILMVISAMVLDIGLAYSVKSELQKDLDSVALAAVRNLPADSTASSEWNNAIDTALVYAQSNGITDLSDSNISPVYKGGKIIGLTVSRDVDVDYGFASVLGFNLDNVYNTSTAELLTVNAMSGLLPIALPQEVLQLIINEYESGNAIKLKYGSDKEMDPEILSIYSSLTNSSGWRGAINFLGDDGKVADGGTYKEAMQNGGYDGLVSIDDIEESNPGVMSVDSYVVAGQIAVVPVVVAVDGKKKLQVVGFATIKIESIDKKIVTASYVSSNVVSGPGSTSGGVVLNDYGVKAAKLTN